MNQFPHRLNAQRRRRHGAAVAVLIGTVMMLTGCASSASAPVTSDAATWPRVIDVPAGAGLPAAHVTIPHEPLRIAALTYETAELVASLGLGDRLVAVPAAVQSSVLSNHQGVMSSVGTALPTERDTDPESVIALNPDIVLLSARHGLETGVGAALDQAGITTLTLPNSWADVDEMLTNITLVARAVGADAAGDALSAAIEQGLTPVADTTETAPRVLTLSNQAGQPFVTAGSAFPLELVRLAGGVDASADIGVTQTGPITVEQVISADPDAILLIDMNGSGEKIFQAITANPAMAAVPAIANDRVLLIRGGDVQAMGLARTVAGLSELVAWLNQ